MARILLIDDDREFGDELVRLLAQIGHSATALDNAEDGLRRLVAGEKYDLVLLDNRMPRMSGLEFLRALESEDLDVPVILMTAAPNADTAIQATRRRAFGRGAFGYLIKPVDLDAFLVELEPEIKRVLTVTRPAPRVPIRAADAEEAAGGLIGGSKAMLEVFERIGLLAGDEAVLILGETGTGKDLAAQAIHSNSPRSARPFVAVNCAALSPNLLESELFGHEKHAFTGADRLRKGYFEHADGGTLFLDEVGDMPLELQAKLLRVLQNREITRMGSCEPIEVDVRVLAATSRDLVRLAAGGSFRQDLFYRLEGVTLVMPPLRERGADIERLARHFLRQGGEPVPTLHADTVRRLRAHPWPGNVRQLQNVMARARVAVRARRGNEVLPGDLDFGVLSSPPVAEATDEDAAQAGLRRAVAWAWQSGQPDLWALLQSRLEGELLRHALAQPGASQVKIARRLGISRNTLRERLKQYGLDEPADPPSA